MPQWVLDAKISVYLWTDVPDLTKDLTFAASGSGTYYKRSWANSYYGIKFNVSQAPFNLALVTCQLDVRWRTDAGPAILTKL